MAPLRFNMLGYAFQEGVDLLREGFESSSRALNDAVAAVKREEVAYEAALEQGGGWIGETDGEGGVLWDHHQVLAIRGDAAYNAWAALSKAYAIAAYHHWERYVHRWAACKPRARHEELVAATRAAGYPISARLDDVRDLANALKHGTAQWGKRLEVSWPELFPNGRIQFGSQPDWYESIVLTDANLRLVFDVVSGSGPTVDLLP